MCEEGRSHIRCSYHSKTKIKRKRPETCPSREGYPQVQVAPLWLLPEPSSQIPTTPTLQNPPAQRSGGDGPPLLTPKPYPKS